MNLNSGDEYVNRPISKLEHIILHIYIHDLLYILVTEKLSIKDWFWSTSLLQFRHNDSLYKLAS